MQTQKIVKLYFSFVMAVVAISGLSQFPAANEYMKTALAFFDVEIEEYKATSFDYSKYVQASVKHFNINTANPFDIHFEFENDPANAHARAGEYDKQAMRIEIKSEDAPVSLSSLKLKVDTIDTEKIKSVYLMDGEKKLAGGAVSGEYFVFNGINYSLAAGESGTLYLKVELGEDVKPNDIVRFDLEKAEDLGLKVGGLAYKVKGYYPIKGKPLFIVK